MRMFRRSVSTVAVDGGTVPQGVPVTQRQELIEAKYGRELFKAYTLLSYSMRFESIQLRLTFEPGFLIEYSYMHTIMIIQSWLNHQTNKLQHPHSNHIENEDRYVYRLCISAKLTHAKQ